MKGRATIVTRAARKVRKHTGADTKSAEIDLALRREGKLTAKTSVEDGDNGEM